MRKILLALSAVAAMLAPVGSGAVPVVSSDNVTLVANIPDVPAVGGRIIDNKLYMSTLRGLRIYDVSLGIPVLLGALELPHWENENLDTNGRIALISIDNFVGTANTLYVIDVSIPHAPLIKGVVPFMEDGHTATCIKDCQFAWTSGGDVIDLRNPSAPRRIGVGSVGGHDINVDSAGYAWTGWNRVIDTNNYNGGLNPPALVSGSSFGWHNSLRPDAHLATPELLADNKIDPGELVLGTDENWLLNFCGSDGPFKTSWFHTVNGVPRVDLLDSHRVGSGTLLDGRKPGIATTTCSSHWFDFKDNVVADSWYEQGTRFLDVSNPRDIKQIGWFMPGVTMSWASLFHEVKTGPTAGLYVYVLDGIRGIDILKFQMPVRSGSTVEPVEGPVATTAPVATQPHPKYGWACRILPAA